MNNSQFAPTHSSQYSSKDMNANLQGMSFTGVAGSTTNGEMLVSDDHILDGCEVSALSGIADGDYFIGQVVDKNYIYAGALYPSNYNGIEWSTAQPDGVILNTFVPKWVAVPGLIKQLSYESKFPAKIYAGLYLRVSYVSHGSTDVKVIVNYKLHKVLL